MRERNWLKPGLRSSATNTGPCMRPPSPLNATITISSPKKAEASCSLPITCANSTPRSRSRPLLQLRILVDALAEDLLRFGEVVAEVGNAGEQHHARRQLAQDVARVAQVGHAHFVQALLHGLQLLEHRQVLLKVTAPGHVVLYPDRRYGGAGGQLVARAQHFLARLLRHAHFAFHHAHARSLDARAHAEDGARHRHPANRFVAT